MYFVLNYREICRQAWGKKWKWDLYSCCLHVCGDACVSMRLYPGCLSFTNFIFLLQVPSAPPTYTGRQLWWVRGLERRCVVKKNKWGEEEDVEGEEGRGPGREARLVVLDLKHGCQKGPFTLCTDLNTDCVPINYCMSACVRVRESRVWRTELKLF